MNISQAIAGLVLLLGAASAQADTYGYGGNTTGAPVFHRPITATDLSTVGTAVPFNALKFTVSAAGAYEFNSYSYTQNFDNYTVLYRDQFSAANPLANLLVTNDDGEFPGVSGFIYYLSAGTPYIFVNTGFENADVGEFYAEISGAGAITAAVPEPETWGMLVAGLGLLALARKRPIRIG